MSTDKTSTGKPSKPLSSGTAPVPASQTLESLAESFYRSVYDFDFLYEQQRRHLQSLAEYHHMTSRSVQRFAQSQTAVMAGVARIFLDAAADGLKLHHPHEIAQLQLTTAGAVFRLVQAETRRQMQQLLQPSPGRDKKTGSTERS